MSDSEKDPVVIDEVVTLEPEGTEAKFTRAEFATVVFHNIAETYPEDAHIECTYTVTADLTPTTRDYVALFKVGWMSPRDYIYYEWAPIPKDYKQGSDADASVMFPAHKLPKDDGEFYQFCYVSGSGQIKGASTPFQFRRPGADDFVEVEDEETNMLVIRSKTIYLEENLQKAESQRQKLQETQEALQKERDSVITKYQEVRSRLNAMETENAKLKDNLKSHEATIQQQKREAKDLITVRDELQARIDKLKKEQVTLNQSIEAMTSDLEAANNKIRSLREELTATKTEVRQLNTKVDELDGKNATLEEEAKLYKNQYESSALNMDQYSKQSESLQIKLAQQESLIEHLRRNVDQLTMELEDNRENLDKQTALNLRDKDRVQDLEERLKNAEDKLMAAEESKIMLQKEITAFEVTQHEMSRVIEKSKTENESLKQKLCALEEDFTQKTQIQALELEQILSDLQGSVQEKESLQKENSRLMHELEKSAEGFGSRSILQQSLTQIKERLEKKEKQCRSMEKMMKGREMDFIEREREMRREIEDLKEKIYMCGEEYKKIFIENSKLKKKAEKKSGRKKTKSESSDTTLEAKTVAEVPLTSSDGTLCLEISEHMEELEKVHEKKLMKKEKYKKQYKEEREKNEQLTSKFEEEIQEKDSEIARLKKRIRDLPNDWDLKVRALEKCVTEKEMIIDDLNKKLRESTQVKKDGTCMSPIRSAPVQSGAPWIYPSVCPCPYPSPPPWPPTGYPYPGQIQYPYPSGPRGAPVPARPPLMVYPHPNMQVPPVPPRTRAAVNDQEKRSQTGENKVETTDTPSDPFGAPLKPLPEPLQPQKLPSAKVAVVRSATHLDEPDGMVEHFDEAEADGVVEGLKVTLPQELKVLLPEEQKSAAHHVMEFTATENDRFYDAEGSGMKFCSECSKTFPADIDEDMFVEHQMSHFETLCPLCKMFKPENMTDEDFERHVNKHYEDEDQYV